MDNGIIGSIYGKYPDKLFNFDQDVETVLSELNLKTDSLDDPEFDVVTYINRIFPNEQSLANIDEVIADTEKKIKDLESETKSIIHDSWQYETGGQDVVEDAMQTIKTLFARVHDVQDRATRSEEMVHEITKDIQLLDQAKRNLTVSITTLNNLILIVNALDRLNDILLTVPANENKGKYSSAKDSGNPFRESGQGKLPLPRTGTTGTPDRLTMPLLTELSDLLSQVQYLMQPMQSAYGLVPAVSGLARELDVIHSVLSDRLLRELKSLLSATRAPSDSNAALILSVCKLIDLLPTRTEIRSDLLCWFITRQLTEYNELFDPSQTIAWLDKIDHRYSWIRSNLPQFERKYGNLFPEEWHVSEQLVLQFCRQTHLHLEVVMKRRRSELTHNLIIFGLQRTLAFESSLNKVYTHYSPLDAQALLPAPTVSGGTGERSLNPFDDVCEEGNENGNAEKDDVTLEKKETDDETPDAESCDWKKPPFDGIISSCFDAHFDLYLGNVEKALQDQLTNRLIGDLTINKSSLTNQELSGVFQDDKTGNQVARTPSGGFGASGGDSAENTLYSATDLFLLYKQVIKQTLQLNRGQGLLGLVRLLRQYLSQYNVCVLLAHIPGVPAAAGTGGSTGNSDLATKMATFSFGSGFSAFGIGRNQTTSSTQPDTTKLLNKVSADTTAVTANQLFTSLLRDEPHAVKLSNDDVSRVCVLLVTASFCYKTVEELEKRLKSEVRPPNWSNRISFLSELDGFTACRSVCVHRLVSDLEAGAEPQLAAMARLPWNNLIQVGDQSIFVTEIVNHLRAHIPLMREALFNLRATFTQICIKFAGALITRFVAALFRCKPLNMFGAEQLLLDTQSLKSALNQMPTFGAKLIQSPPRSFTSLVQEGMGRAERILKAVMLPVGRAPAPSTGTVESSTGSVSTGSGVTSTGFVMGPVDAHSADHFLTSFRQLLPDANSTDLQKVLDMKGVKTTEQQLILEAFRAYGESRTSAGSQSVSATTPETATSTSVNVAAIGEKVNHIKKSGAIKTVSGIAGGSELPKSVDQLVDQPSTTTSQQPPQPSSGRMRHLEKLVKIRRS